MAACPFGVASATTWLNLMMIGCCADAATGAKANAAAAAARDAGEAVDEELVAAGYRRAIGVGS